ncbi:MAG: adenylyltransferase/cytidyltransferase family protein [bacterium]|nr:adenylyltransferase/cytidyltransferase family protein [bacterium]
MKNPRKQWMRWAAVSGGFDPIHVGHIRMLKKARGLGGKLVVILNNDNWLLNKKGYAFMPEKERAEILSSLPFVDKVYITKHKRDDGDMSVCKALAALRPAIFANGGDRKGKKDIPEASVCEDLGIKMVFNVGGGKVQSSSWMIKGVSRPISKTVRPWGEYYGWDRGKTWNLKTVYIKPGKRLSLQYHNHREECWMLVEGDATATIHEKSGVREVALKKGGVFRVSKKQTHRLASNNGGVIVEVAQGKFSEEDIVRLEDDHGRPVRKRRQ